MRNNYELLSLISVYVGVKDNNSKETRSNFDLNNSQNVQQKNNLIYNLQ